MFQHVLFEDETYASILGTRNSLTPPPRLAPCLHLVCFRRLGVDMIIALITSVLIEDLLHECLDTSTVIYKQMNKKLLIIIKVEIIALTQPIDKLFSKNSTIACFCQSWHWPVWEKLLSGLIILNEN